MLWRIFVHAGRDRVENDGIQTDLMRKFSVVFLIMFSCGPAAKDFKYEIVDNESAIVFKNYEPIDQKSLAKFLGNVPLDRKFDSLNIFLTAENINSINPKFKKKYFSQKYMQRELKWNSYDTLKLLRNTYIHFGTFKDNTITVERYVDSSYLDNGFITNN